MNREKVSALETRRLKCARRISGIHLMSVVLDDKLPDTSNQPGRCKMNSSCGDIAYCTSAAHTCVITDCKRVTKRKICLIKAEWCSYFFFRWDTGCGNDRPRVNIQIQLNVYWRSQSVSIGKQNLLLSITHFNYGVKSFILYANVAQIPF